MNLARCLLGAAFVAFAVPAWAGATCYSPEQMQAEQLLRLHSELMVITVTCRQGSEGQDLPAAYGAFTQKNIHLLHNAEQTMIAYYKATTKGDAVGHLDHLRTLLGNEFGQKAADMSAPNFCAAYRDKVLYFAGAPQTDVDTQVRRMEISDRSYAKSCGARKTFVAKKGG